MSQLPSPNEFCIVNPILFQSSSMQSCLSLRSQPGWVKQDCTVFPRVSEYLIAKGSFNPERFLISFYIRIDSNVVLVEEFWAQINTLLIEIGSNLFRYLRLASRYTKAASVCTGNL